MPGPEFGRWSCHGSQRAWMTHWWPSTSASRHSSQSTLESGAGPNKLFDGGSNCSTPLWHWGGEILDFATCCRNTDTHDVLKEDPITGFIDAYWRFDVRNGWQTVPIRTAACCGSSDTGGKITTEIRRWRGVSKASIRPSGHIDNGQGHSDRVLKNGKRKRTNYDSSHWDVGAATRDLLRVGVTATSRLGRKARRVQPVPHAPNLSPPVL
jgi:hypothetical protein